MVRTKVLGAPDTFQDLIVAQNPTLIPSEEGEKPELRSRQQEVGAVQEQRMRMETIGQTPVFIRFFVMRTAMDEQILARRNREFESLLTTIGAEAFPARYSQLLLWKSSLPVGSLT